MLAERKQKMRWTPNPCGNFWSKDGSKFGQKILEKFGWSPGKGLGVNEQGITAPVRLKCNSTQKGLGFERSNNVGWFLHQEEFNSILTNLNSSDGEIVQEQLISLEQQSKSCKTRVHYHKFTRGKDLSRYSEKDLSCILGAFSKIEKNRDSTRNKSTLVNEYDDNFSENHDLMPGSQEDNQKDFLDLEETKKSKSSKKKRKKKYSKMEKNHELTPKESNLANEYDNDVNENQDATQIFQEDTQEELAEKEETKKTLSKRKRKRKCVESFEEDEESLSITNCIEINQHESESNNHESVEKSKKKKKKHKRK